MDNIPTAGIVSYGHVMSDLRTDLYVTLRTAPKSLAKRYASARLAMEGDQATRELVDLIMEVLDRYSVEPKELPRPVWPTTPG